MFTSFLLVVSFVMTSRLHGNQNLQCLQGYDPTVETRPSRGTGEKNGSCPQHLQGTTEVCGYVCACLCMHVALTLKMKNLKSPERDRPQKGLNEIYLFAWYHSSVKSEHLLSCQQVSDRGFECGCLIDTLHQMLVTHFVLSGTHMVL